MPTTTQTLSTIPQENKVFYERILLKRLIPNLVYAKYGQKKSMPKREGATVNFRRFNSLTPPNTPLIEGVTPNGSNLSVTTVNATIQQYGDFVEMSDMLDMVGIDPVATEAAEVLGEEAGLQLDTIVRDVVTNGTTVQYANSALNANGITNTAVMTNVEVMKAVRTLKNNNAKRMPDGYFLGIVDAYVAFDLMKDPLWQDVSKYNGGTKIMKGELGKLAGVRFVETTNGVTANNSNNVTVHKTMIIAQDAYGIPDIEGSSKPEMIIKPAGSAGTADPLNQRSSAGYKFACATVRLQELAMVRIETAASA